MKNSVPSVVFLQRGSHKNTKHQPGLGQEEVLEAWPLDKEKGIKIACFGWRNESKYLPSSLVVLIHRQSGATAWWTLNRLKLRQKIRRKSPEIQTYFLRERGWNSGERGSEQTDTKTETSVRLYTRISTTCLSLWWSTLKFNFMRWLRGGRPLLVSEQYFFQTINVKFQKSIRLITYFEHCGLHTKLPVCYLLIIDE